jgi:hypothetical protein
MPQYSHSWYDAVLSFPGMTHYSHSWYDAVLSFPGILSLYSLFNVVTKTHVFAAYLIEKFSKRVAKLENCLLRVDGWLRVSHWRRKYRGGE